MAIYAVGNPVSNIIVAENQESAEFATGGACREIPEGTPAGIGWVYDEATSTFINPNAEVAP